MRIAGRSRDRLLAAASLEFAARGFDGAKVDRIAARARVNKAMVYYHFEDKAALYREILRALFESVAASLSRPPARGASPEDRIREFIRTVAAETAARPHYPSIWLREMSEGGRHLDASIVKSIGEIIQGLAAILRDGHQTGRFRPVHPVIVQMSVIAPLLLFAASAPTRERFSGLIHGAADVPRDTLVAYLEAATLSTLAARSGDRSPTEAGHHGASTSPGHRPAPRPRAPRKTVSGRSRI